VGTENGLYRYDGNRFRHFGKAQGLSEGHVTALHVDPAGRLWVATERGVSHFDGSRLVALQRADGRPLGVRIGQHLASLAPHLLLVQATGRLMKVRINDTHGHLAGDAVLKELVRRLQALVRASDTVGRYGGEEFVLLLPELDLDGGGDRLGHLHRAIGGEPFDIGGGETLAVMCSCGVAVGKPAMGLTPEQWLDLADKALYRAKANGRNRIEFA